MGFSVSRFSEIAKMARNRGSRSVFSKFKTLALVLHDPNDQNFVRDIRWNMAELSEQTGADFLFMTFCNPPDDFSKMPFEMREKMEMISSRMNDEQAALAYFCKKLGENTKLPVIVFSTDIDSRKVIVIKTDIHKYKDQLEELGHYSSYPYDIDINDFSLFCAPHLGECRRVTLKSSLRDELLDVLAMEESVSFSPNKQKAKDFIRQRFDSLKRQMESSYEESFLEHHDLRNLVLSYITDENDLSEHDNRHYSRFGHDTIEDDYSQNLYPNPTYYQKTFGISPDSVPNIEMWDENSRFALRSYNKSLKFKDTDNFGDADEYGLTENIFSFRDEIQNIYDILSREINQSLVQLMRHSQGIDMPEFYMQCVPGANYYIRTQRDVVYLNSYVDTVNYDWRAPELGRSHAAYKLLLRDDRFAHFFAPYHSLQDMTFLDAWNNCARIRNKFSHGSNGLPAERDFSPMYNDFYKLIHDYMFMLMQVKHDMRGQ